MIPVTAAPIVIARHVSRTFTAGGVPHTVLHAVDFTVRTGELVALRGRSGAGKTTLLNILTGIVVPSEGSVLVLGHELTTMSADERALLRRQRIGLLFQNAHLFPALTALENVEIPLRLSRVPASERMRRARDAIALVGLAARARHRGLELSGGEQQRIALARALTTAPRLVVADEPTGTLDSTTGRAIVAMLRDIAHEANIGMVVATHDAAVLDCADRVVLIADGRISE